MKVEKFDMTVFDRTTEALRALWEHRKAVPTTKSDELYYKLVLDYYMDIRKALEQEKPLVAHTVALPMEILYALDVVPYLMEVVGVAMVNLNSLWEEAFSAASQYGLPPEVCSGHRGPIGLILKGWIPRPTAAIWSNLVCDNTAKSSQVLAHLLDCPGYFLDRAYGFSEAEVKYFTRELEDLVEFLEKVTGHKMDWDKLQEAVKNSEQVAELQDEIAELRKAVPAPMRNRGGMMQHLISFYLPGRPEAVDFFKVLRDEVKEQVALHRGFAARENYRLTMYFEPPAWGWKILDWMERAHGAIIVSEPVWTYWGSMRIHADTPLEALARKTFARPVCWQFNGPAENIARHMVRGAKEYGADGAFSFCHVGCRQSSAANRIVKDALSEEVGIPFWTMDCDIGDPTVTSEEQIKDKLEAFFEVLDERK